SVNKEMYIFLSLVIRVMVYILRMFGA
ncbi:MAG: hypothetical protein RIS79_4056, partial [Verrucomicrobiota bacterium]